ncbi:DUF6789 family protein [Sediminibacterium sp.]|uniref:DUF6789 family protein n=1 Tax=Sediminibacterium sp. TaxID=1917865 RepID=UPI0025FA4056|nr:DUF6789 family protein [Sediminibacterium sp.]MBT9484494.1 hypothetical protein [Sediminibacterium sp.]
MQYKIKQSVISGVDATIAMSLLMMLGAAMGMPKMSPPDMLTGMMKVPVAAGWVMHFMIGIIFAAGYVFLFNNWLKKISNKLLRGAVYGIVAFIVAQISIPVLGAIFGDAGMPEPEGSMALLMIGSIMGHVVFGIVIALIVKPVILFTKNSLR